MDNRLFCLSSLPLQLNSMRPTQRKHLLQDGEAAQLFGILETFMHSLVIVSTFITVGIETCEQ